MVSIRIGAILMHRLRSLACILLTSVPVIGAGAGDAAISEAEVAWFEPRGSGYDVLLKRRINGRWQDTLVVNSDGAVNTHPMVAGDARGRSFVIWTVWEEDAVKLLFSVVEGDQTGLPRNIPPVRQYNMAPHVVVDGDGWVWLAWSAEVPDDADIFVTRWDGAGWVAPQQVNSEDDWPDIVPVLGVGTDGQPWVCWMGYDGNRYERFCSYFDGASWSAEAKDGGGDARAGAIAAQMEGGVPLPEEISDPDSATVFDRRGGQIRSWRKPYARYFQTQ